MKENFDIQEYMTKGVQRIVREALRATLKNPKESEFMVRFARASRKADKKRRQEEAEGLHVPAFLIASITSSCNLHCAGCYSRSNHATTDCAPAAQLTGEEWGRIFAEAEELGISFIILLGGEPLLRPDVIEAAGNRRNILFPVFTNGTFLNAHYLEQFDRCRNLLPVLSIEGGKEETDARRGEGVYDRLMANMEQMQKAGLIYGASITVTKENLKQSVSASYLDQLFEKGCKAVFFVEYVPMDENSRSLAPEDADREFLRENIDRLRRERPEMLFIAFPGDEKSSGGCLAAGRGFFHINSHGGAEPCPVSAFSDINVRDASLKEALHSRLFRALREGDLLMEDHAGGCVLYERREQVEALLHYTRERI